jgi:predicted PurR-regulated permease PerM
VVSSVDNVLRPIIISGQGGIPFVMVFFGVIGGLASFGLIGLFVGPVLLSVAYTLLQELSRTPLPAPKPPPAAPG